MSDKAGPPQETSPLDVSHQRCDSGYVIGSHHLDSSYSLLRVFALFSVFGRYLTQKSKKKEKNDRTKAM